MPIHKEIICIKHTLTYSTNYQPHEQEGKCGRLNKRYLRECLLRYFQCHKRLFYLNHILVKNYSIFYT